MFDSRVGRFVAVSMVVVGLPLAGGHLLLTPSPVNGELDTRVIPPVDEPDLEVAFHDDLFGRSGALRTIQALPATDIEIPLTWNSNPTTDTWYRWVPYDEAALPGKSSTSDGMIPLPESGILTSPHEPGVYHLEVGAGPQRWLLDEVPLIVQVPFEGKEGTHLNGYFIGRYPTEGKGRRDRYAPPAGFIEVTRENQNLQLSDHFKIREFLTKDQHNVWPKYVVVDPLLLEKLELMMQELNAMGVRAEKVFVMSGFRTPQYNARGLGQGRASLSRHQFGDAADIWIDNDWNGYIDDLNGDGKRDTGDVRVMLRAIERVEKRYPELTGGAGVYRATSAHGPFLHVDVRGTRARW